MNYSYTVDVATFGSCTSPTSKPTAKPTSSPTQKPTPMPTSKTTQAPNPAPVLTSSPTQKPTPMPTSKTTQAPNPSPVLNPTRKPTTSPVQAPAPVSSNPMCQDTWLTFLINGNSRNCKWVYTQKVEVRCGKPGVTDLCPLTCGVDCTPFDTVGDFEHMNGNDRDCAFVAVKPAKRCNNNNFRSHCPVTCAGYSYD